MIHQDNINLTVIVPVYDTRAYLDACLESIFAQTLEKIEVICVDNGSNDGSFEYLQIIEKKRKDLVVIRHPIGRLGDARNAGLQIARGKYISFVDSDDFIHQNMLLDMYQKLEQYKADIAICNMTIFLQKENRYIVKDSRDIFSIPDSFTLLENVYLLQNLTSCNKVFLKSFLDTHNLRFPENSFHEDQYFVIKALIQAEKLVTIDEPYYYYRKQRDNAISALNDESMFQIFRIYGQIDSFLDTLTDKARYADLVDQVRAQRYIIFANQIQWHYLFSYCKKIKKELANHSPKSVILLNESERSQLSIISRYHYLIYVTFLLLRKGWGKLLAIKAFRSMNNSARKVS